MSSEPSPPPCDEIGPHHGFGSHVVRLAELVMVRARDALAPLDLTPMAYNTLASILEGEGLSQQELSRRLNIYAPKMVGVIDELETRGLVERKPSPEDRRRNRLLLTAAGAALLRRANAAAQALEDTLFGELPDADKARFNALVDRLEAEAPAERS